MKKSSNRIFVYLSLCHILYICECFSCPFFPPPSLSSFLYQCIVQAESSLFISLLPFVNPFSPDSDTIAKTVEYISFTYLLYIYQPVSYLHWKALHDWINKNYREQWEWNTLGRSLKRINKENHKTLVGMTEIWTRIFLNANEMCYPLSCTIQTYKWHYRIIPRCWYSLTNSYLLSWSYIRHTQTRISTISAEPATGPIPQASWIHSTISQPISARFILILYSHLHLCLRSSRLLRTRILLLFEWLQQ